MSTVHETRSPHTHVCTRTDAAACDAMLAAKRAHEGGGDAAASSSRGSADVEIPMLPLSRHATANDSASDEAPVCRICASEGLFAAQSSQAAAFSDRHFNMAACARVQPYLDSL